MFVGRIRGTNSRTIVEASGFRTEDRAHVHAPHTCCPLGAETARGVEEQGIYYRHCQCFVRAAITSFVRRIRCDEPSLAEGFEVPLGKKESVDPTRFSDDLETKWRFFLAFALDKRDVDQLRALLSLKSNKIP